ncbi:hypothetical protein ACFPYI_14520 [Halomarina salina]|uniref:Cox cluster protein n=1 Tax=Halomarina salina TaxID=1872699 RepID=A0ABD5RPH9_9EURY|nr:hypothetical protein [Halomarina salina]
MRRDHEERTDAASETDEHWPGDELLDDDRPGLDPMPLVVGAFVAVSGILLFVQPVVRVVTLFGRPVPPFVLAPAPLSLGLAIGTFGFARRGERTVAIAHGVGAVGFGLMFLATGVGTVVFLWLGLAVVLGGVVFLVLDARR